MWGIIPAAGAASEFSRWRSPVLLPVGSRTEDGWRRPCAFRNSRGADDTRRRRQDLFRDFTSSPTFSNISEVSTAVPRSPMSSGRMPRDSTMPSFGRLRRRRPGTGVGRMPDTVWFPSDALARCPTCRCRFCFSRRTPRILGSGRLDGRCGQEVQVEAQVFGIALGVGSIQEYRRRIRELKALWQTPERQDEYFGTLVNAYLGNGGAAIGIQTGESLCRCRNDQWLSHCHDPAVDPARSKAVSSTAMAADACRIGANGAGQ